MADVTSPDPKNQPPFTNLVDQGGIGTAVTARLGSAPSGTGITTVRSADDLNKVATSQVDSELQGQISPLQSQYNTLGDQETRAAGAIQDMFGSILPYSQAAAGAVQGAYGAAQGAEANIMAAANERLNQLKQSRAQQAQALAQEMGGPVSLGEFTAGLDDQASLLATLGAGQQLHTLQYGLADVGQANAFAGRVLPLVESEQTAQSRAKFEDQRRQIQDQITSLKGQRSSKINAAYNDLLAKERDYALQKTQQALDKVKNQHDWQATLRTLKNDDARVALAQHEAGLQEAGVTGTYKGKPTLAAQQLTVQERQQAQQLGLSEKEYQLRKQQLIASTKDASTRIRTSNQSTWAQYLDAAVNPQPGKSVTTTQWVPVDASQAFKDKSVIKGKDGQYYKPVKTVQTPVASAITEPNSLVDYLVAHLVPKQVAVRMVKARLRIPNWQYGQRDPHAPPLPKPRSGPPAPGRTQPGPFPH